MSGPGSPTRSGWAKSQTGLLYAFSILVIFLCWRPSTRAGRFRSPSCSLLPLGVIGAVLATSFRGLPNDVYFQIGLLTTLGLTTKNAILIIQFAKIRMEQGEGLVEATLEAAKLRLRPIVMTSLAFGFGVLPLAICHRGGGGSPKCHRHRRPGRHGHRHLPGDFLHPPVLCDGGATVRREGKAVAPNSPAPTQRARRRGDNMTRKLLLLASVA